MDRHTLQQGFQRSGLLAGRHQIAIQRIEAARLFAQGFGQAGTCGDRLFQPLHQLAHSAVVEAIADDVESLQQGNPGLQQRRQLASEQGDIRRFDRRCESSQNGGFLAHMPRADALLAQLGPDPGKIVARGLPAHPASFAIDAFPGVQR